MLSAAGASKGGMFDEYVVASYEAGSESDMLIVVFLVSGLCFVGVRVRHLS